MANKNSTLPNSINTGTLIVDNITLPPDTLARVTIYVRSTGSDTTGDGSSGAPFRTLQFALNTIPQLQASGAYYLIDCTGINDTVSTPIVFPSYLPSTPAQGSQDLAPFSDDEYVTIYAQPNVLETLSSSTTSTTDDHTGMITLNVPGASFTADEYKNKYIIGPGIFDFAMIITNTADTVTTTALFLSDLTQLKIVSEGATFTADTGVSSTFAITSCKAGLAFDSIAIAHTDSTGSSVYGQFNDYIAFYTCSMKNLFLTNNMSLIAYASYVSGYSLGDAFADNIIGGLSQTYNGCIFYGTSPTISGTFSACYIDTCRWLEEATNFSLTSCWFNNYGLIVEAGSNAVLSDCRFDNSAAMPHLNPQGSGIVVDGGSITFAEGNHAGHSSDMGGTGNAGYGIELRGGGNAWMQSGHAVNFSVTGAMGDLKNGNKPARTWTDFTTNNPMLTDSDPFGQMTYIGQNTDTMTSNVNYDGQSFIYTGAFGAGTGTAFSLRTATDDAVGDKLMSWGGTTEKVYLAKETVEDIYLLRSTGSYIGMQNSDGDGIIAQGPATVYVYGANNAQVLFSANTSITDVSGFGLSFGTLGAPWASIFGTDLNLGGLLTASNATAPTVTLGAGAGSGASITVTGNDTRGTISITAGTGGTSNAIVASILFARSYPATPVVILDRQNQASLAQTVIIDQTSISTTGFNLTIGASTLNASDTYLWSYWVIG